MGVPWGRDGLLRLGPADAAGFSIANGGRLGLRVKGAGGAWSAAFMNPRTYANGYEAPLIPHQAMPRGGFSLHAFTQVLGGGGEGRGHHRDVAVAILALLRAGARNLRESLGVGDRGWGYAYPRSPSTHPADLCSRGRRAQETFKRCTRWGWWAPLWVSLGIREVP
jgi:hypothetical protein